MRGQLSAEALRRRIDPMMRSWIDRGFQILRRRHRSSGSLYVHEDALEEIQLLPVRNRAWCEREIAKIDGFSQEHVSPDGLGWTEMYFRGRPEFPLAGLRLDFATTSAALRQRLPAIDLVEPNPFTDWTEKARALAFGAPGAAVIIADYGGGCIESIDLQLDDDDRARAVLAAAAAIRSPEPLLVVNWPRLQLSQLDRAV